MFKVLSGVIGSGLVACWFVACGGEPPKQANSGDAVRVDEAPEAQNAEWLYATKGVAISDLKSECEAVRTAIKQEENCLAETCMYASRLTEDWIRRCQKTAPQSLEEVSAFARTYNERKKAERVPCMREIDEILTKGCGDRPDCADVAQEWTTRCSGVTQSPLVVRILEARVEQGAGASNVKLDKRSCPALAHGMLEAANCAQRFECEDALAGADTFRKRCVVGDKLPTLREAMSELSIRIGAGQAPPHLPISPNSPELGPKDFALLLADGTGAVVQTCGERPTDLGSYLAARSQCEGEIVVLQRQPGRAKSAVRIGRFAYNDDLAFAQAYPSLLIKGERDARISQGLERLAASLDDAAQKATAQEAAAALIQALEKEAFSVRAIGSAPPALQERDTKLVILFRSLALAKIDAAKSIFKPLDYASLMRRSLKRPLADIGGDGRFSLGASTPAAGLELEKVLPQSISAYKNELAVFVGRVKKKDLSPTQQGVWREQQNQAGTSCATAQGKVREAEGALVECAFGGCEAEMLTDLQTELDGGRKESAKAYLRFVLAQASMDPGDEPTGQAARCEQPWW